MARVALLLSGGVDSAAAALRLRAAGHAVTGVTLRLSEAEDGGAPDAASARAAATAAGLGLPHHVVDLRDAFAARVRAPFLAAYRAGRTPNPCVDCNPAVKFGLAFDWARRHLDAECLASGHYVRRAEGPEGVRLGRAACRDRDQSYFLYRVPRERWPALLFPLGDAPDKDAVRAEVRAAGLAAADAGDSMDVCFLPDGDYRSLLPPATAADGGVFTDIAGRVLGRHAGHARFTVGQRRGLGRAFGFPAYVVAIRAAEHVVVLGRREDALRREVRAARAVFAGPAPAPGARLGGRVRSGGEPAPCVVLAADAGAGTLAVRFDAPVFAPAPGQHLVLYDDGGWLVGGGAIVDEAPVSTG